jgi:hypothetical protein
VDDKMIDKKKLGYESLPLDFVFVFGSNEGGRHGKGAALVARLQYGAKSGQGKGRQGQSYGIPTKDRNLRVLPLDLIYWYVTEFLHYAFLNPEVQFKVTDIGCGLAGYTAEQIAPFFQNAPKNCYFSERFLRYV